MPFSKTRSSVPQESLDIRQNSLVAATSNLITCPAPSQSSLNRQLLINATMTATNAPLTDIELESIQASDFESDTIRDSDKNLNESATGRSSFLHSPPVNRTQKAAPIVHMHSICSMSDTTSSSVQNSATNVRLLAQLSPFAPQSDCETTASTKQTSNLLNIFQTNSTSSQPPIQTSDTRKVDYYLFLFMF